MKLTDKAQLIDKPAIPGFNLSLCTTEKQETKTIIMHPIISNLNPSHLNLTLKFMQTLKFNPDLINKS